jgi:hypothetical protein
MAAYPNTRYTVVDGENPQDHALDMPSEVVLHDTREGGRSQTIATFERYGDAVMFAHMKNSAPQVRADYTKTPDGEHQGCLVVVDTDEIIGRFVGPDCDDQLMEWLMRDYPLLAAIRSL